ncbi:hypothetical protein BDR04DRAFT_1126854 [Suillus decipiens]|nr:hypothetical protein BDR04DRAFT_1126854 [Suillus decipiens]
MSLNLKHKPHDKPTAHNRPMTVYSFINSHPHATQAEIVKHFKSLKSGALAFTQSTLSCKLRERTKMEACINDNPNTLSSKQPRIVTRSGIEHVLILWIRHMENKYETKWKRFEDEFDVLDNERLLGEAWVPLFCKAYKISGSVDTKAVVAEQEHCCKILAKFAPQDQWNFNETSFFP